VREIYIGHNCAQPFHPGGGDFNALEFQVITEIALYSLLLSPMDDLGEAFTFSLLSISCGPLEDPADLSRPECTAFSFYLPLQKQPYLPRGGVMIRSDVFGSESPFLELAINPGTLYAR